MTTVLAAIVPTTDSLAAPPPSYAMVCKGGGDMLITADMAMSMWFMKLLIKKSAFRGDSGKLVAGECAWLDRPLTTAEPRTLVVAGGWKVSRAEFLAKNRTLSSFTFAPIGTDPAQVAAAADAQKLLADAWTADKTFYVHAHVNTTGNTLVVTKIGP